MYEMEGPRSAFGVFTASRLLGQGSDLRASLRIKSPASVPVTRPPRRPGIAPGLVSFAADKRSSTGSLFDAQGVSRDLCNQIPGNSFYQQDVHMTPQLIPGVCAFSTQISTHLSTAGYSH